MSAPASSPVDSPVAVSGAARPVETLDDLDLQLTPVERFAAGDRLTRKASDDGGRQFRDLIPLSKPRPGEQYAFQVDLDRCSGCKACVSACHHLNGLEPEETWRSVGLLVGSSHKLPVLQHVTTACHHCLEPACLIGCPTGAYEKNSLTGIVQHLDDQCFGCQYCTLACPYEVPRYSATKGIVRKCDMCHGRLANGEAPACVQACPNEAIRITVVQQTEVRRVATESSSWSGIPPASLTLPTTCYSGRHARSQLVAADSAIYVPQHAHQSLIVMLVLTQLSVGIVSLLPLLLYLVPGATLGLFNWLLRASLLTGLIGVHVAMLHLGRPLLAFRAVIGWRRSWLSREAIAFGLYLPALAGAVATTEFGGDDLPLVGASFLTLAMIVGWVGVICSVRIYQFTRRPFWIGSRTALKFSLSCAILGLAAVVCEFQRQRFGAAPRDVGQEMSFALMALIACSFAKLAYEASLYEIGSVPADSLALCGSVDLLRHQLKWQVLIRTTLSVMGGIVLPLVLWQTAELGPAGSSFSVAAVMLAITIAGELAERTIFFKAAVPWRMPGGIPT